MDYTVEDVINFIAEYKRNLKDRLDSQEFYEMMQEYRQAPISNQAGVTFRFNAVKEFILASIEQ